MNSQPQFWGIYPINNNNQQAHTLELDAFLGEDFGALGLLLEAVWDLAAALALAMVWFQGKLN